jgi:Xaa-Pro aminopeptidase
MFVLPKEGVVGLEDDYLVTAQGLRRLTLTQQAVIHI